VHADAGASTGAGAGTGLKAGVGVGAGAKGATKGAGLGTIGAFTPITPITGPCVSTRITRDHNVRMPLEQIRLVQDHPGVCVCVCVCVSECVCVCV
jgi:hypothetical protein